MKKNHLCLGLVFQLLCSTASHAQTFDVIKKHETAIGAVKLNICIPDTFVNLMDDVEFKEFALAGKMPANELLGVYADATAAGKAKAGELLPFFLRVGYTTKFRDRTFTETDLAALRQTAEGKTPPALKPGSPEYEALMRRVTENISRAAKKKLDFTVPDIAHFGIVASAAGMAPVD